MRSGPDRPGEFELIARYFAPLARNFPGARGLLDDVATIAPAAGMELVLKTDAIVAGVDFLADDPPGLVARKALRVNLSDIAAKGARPRVYLVALVLPAAIDAAWIEGFAAGLARDQDEFGVHLAGGDLSATPGPLTVSVTLIGEAPAGRILRRDGAHAGDTVFVSGTIGDGALGLRARRGELRGLDAAASAFLVDRYLLPQPRCGLGPALIGVASAALDVSDGLVADLRHLCEASGLAAELDEGRVPLSDPARAAVAADPSLGDTVLTGGDDYEILFAAPVEASPRIAEITAACGVGISAIGRLRAARPAAIGVEVIAPDGRRRRLAREGWTHF